MLKQLKDWQLKYIELKAQIENAPSDVECAKIIGISRQWISVFKREHPEHKQLIRDRLSKKTSEIGIEAVQALVKGIRKGNPKLIQIGLEMDKLYTPKQELTNRYDGMEKEQIAKEIELTAKQLLNQNGIVMDQNEIGGEKGD